MTFTKDMSEEEFAQRALEYLQSCYGEHTVEWTITRGPATDEGLVSMNAYARLKYGIGE